MPPELRMMIILLHGVSIALSLLILTVLVLLLLFLWKGREFVLKLLW